MIKYAWPQDVWFHVDKLSSAHVYLRLPESIPSWEAIPEALLVDCAQLVKANSIEGESETVSPSPYCSSNLNFSGNKRNDLTIIYTPADNLKVRPSIVIIAYSQSPRCGYHKENRRHGRRTSVIPERQESMPHSFRRNSSCMLSPGHLGKARCADLLTPTLTTTIPG